MPHYKPDEIEFITRLFAEGHSSRTISIISGRSVTGLDTFRYERKLPSVTVGKNGKSFRVVLSNDAFRSLAACAQELECSPSRLARVVLEICAKKELYGAILDLGGPHTGPAQIKETESRDGEACNGETCQTPAESSCQG
jgi:hypothetical protein